MSHLGACDEAFYQSGLDIEDLKTSQGDARYGIKGKKEHISWMGMKEKINVYDFYTRKYCYERKTVNLLQ